MLLQSLLLIVTLAVIGSAILTSALVSAKSAFHSVIMRQSESAMTDATANFITWAQKNIRDNGIDQLSIWASKPQTASRQPLCVSPTTTPMDTVYYHCNLYQTIEWNITGVTNTPENSESRQLPSEATNLATAQNERRVSATVTIAITNSTGSITYSRQSRELTARVFHAFPYAAITGERDALSESGSISSAEGDTAGYARELQDDRSPRSMPTTSVPASYNKTTLLTTIDCNNSPDNLSPNPMLDNRNVLSVKARSFGNLAWIYEVPCKSASPVDPSTAPSGYKPSTGNVYGSQATYNRSWSKDDENNSTFAQ